MKNETENSNVAENRPVSGIHTVKKRAGIRIMAGLAGLIRPLSGCMLLAVVLGCLGHLAAIAITVLGAYGILKAWGMALPITYTGLFAWMGICAVSRGILRYGEQACNHYIAFRLLARIRHMVFAALRKLAPAKLDGSGKGNLISVLTSDIELLEVFYAHTVSPIAIALTVSGIMTVFAGLQHPLMGIYALACYILVGAVIPVLCGRRGRQKGREYRKTFGSLNTVVLDNLYGLEEIQQYGCEDARRQEMAAGTKRLEEINRRLKREESLQRCITDALILAGGAIALLLSSRLIVAGEMEWGQALLTVTALLSSFGPAAALAALSNNLNQTLASGERVLSLLEEQPLTEEISGGEKVCEGDISCSEVSFAYGEKEILKNFTHTFAQNRIHGIFGHSGSGKTTLLKLLMRFYETGSGSITYGDININAINTGKLRDSIAYVEQETFLFRDTVENNIRLAKPSATREEVEEAAQKASIHDFLLSLPQGYDTLLQESGADLSGGERQRIGLARAFLHDSSMIFLDEPTSNIDSLNEGMILSSLQKAKEGKTVILVSHRASTMGIADNIVEVHS